MNPTSQDIAAILAAEVSLALVLGTNLFVGKEPATPDDSVTIFDIPGGAPLLTLGGKGGGDYFHPSIQIRVRNNAYLTGWDLINDIKTVLHGLNGEIEGTTTYHLIECMLDPFLLDWDTQDRARFVCSFNCQRS